MRKIIPSFLIFFVFGKGKFCKFSLFFLSSLNAQKVNIFNYSFVFCVFLKHFDNLWYSKHRMIFFIINSIDCTYWCFLNILYNCKPSCLDWWSWLNKNIEWQLSSRVFLLLMWLEDIKCSHFRIFIDFIDYIKSGSNIERWIWHQILIIITNHFHVQM